MPRVFCKLPLWPLKLIADVRLWRLFINKFLIHLIHFRYLFNVIGLSEYLTYFFVRVSETLSTLLQTYFVKQWIENTINNVKDWLVWQHFLYFYNYYYFLFCKYYCFYLIFDLVVVCFVTGFCLRNQLLFPVMAAYCRLPS